MITVSVGFVAIFPPFLVINFRRKFFFLNNTLSASCTTNIKRKKRLFKKPKVKQTIKHFLTGLI